MNAEVLSLTAELRDELATSQRRKLVDPCDVPVRFSTLKAFSLSPLHYWQACQDDREETLSMRLGSGADAILFGKPIAVWNQPAKKGAGRAPRNGAAWDAFRAEHDGQVILSANERRQAEALAAAIRANATAARVLFENTTIEQRIDWTWNGRAYRSTPDARGVRHIADLKCLRSAEPRRVTWQSQAMHYHAQAALYRRAIGESLNVSIDECYLVVVENKEPYPVTVLRFTEGALTDGDWLCVLWDEQRRRCEESRTWDGYATDVVELDLPFRSRWGGEEGDL